jgi:hypothetical protein
MSARAPPFLTTPGGVAPGGLFTSLPGGMCAAYGGTGGRRNGLSTGGGGGLSLVDASLDGEEGREGGLPTAARVVAAAILGAGEGDGVFAAVVFVTVVVLAAAVATLSCAVTVPQLASAASASSSSAAWEALMVAVCMCLRFTWDNVHPDHAWDPELAAPATRMPRYPVSVCTSLCTPAGGGGLCAGETKAGRQRGAAAGAPGGASYTAEPDSPPRPPRSYLARAGAARQCGVIASARAPRPPRVQRPVGRLGRTMHGMQLPATTHGGGMHE